MTALTVAIPSYNPDISRLHRVLEALAAQTLEHSHWEVLIIDNASQPAIADQLADDYGLSLRIVPESKQGLTWARRRAVLEAKGRLLAFVDDDNLLAPDYLQESLTYMQANPECGAIGGKSIPEFASQPAEWVREFYGLLALRDLGESELKAEGFSGGVERSYPLFAPIGAGMVLRLNAAQFWLEQMEKRQVQLSDRQGQSLSSSGDNDIVLCVLDMGLGVAYLPQLRLTHLISADRCQAEYLERLNFGIQKSWIQVLSLHGVCPWPACPKWTLPVRKLRAWFRSQGWRRPQARIRWRGQCGHFEGRASIAEMKLQREAR